MTYPRRRPVTVAFTTLGCKVNRSDTNAVARALAARGYVVAPDGSPADIYIVNTCTVTREADAKSRKALRRALRAGDNAVVIATGCYATLEPGQLEAIAGLDAVVPLSEQPSLPDLLTRLRPPTSPAAEAAATALTDPVERTRAFVKIQDGCDRRCAYCAVTLARGEPRSRSIAEIVAEISALLARDIQEIVLTGIRLDAYGLDQPGLRLADLIDATRDLGMTRLRLSSLEPIGIDERLAASLAGHPSFCRHFHICLQSGDDGILRAMNRGYTADGCRRKIALLRAAMPDAAFTTDVMVGFPGETEEAWANTCAFLEEIGFSGLHIFRFSPRPHTEAATMPNQIPESVKEERSRALFALERWLFHAYAQRHLRRDVAVLVERAGARGDGLTPDYLRVRAAFPAGTEGTVRQAHVTGIGEDFLLGSPT